MLYVNDAGMLPRPGNSLASNESVPTSGAGNSASSLLVKGPLSGAPYVVGVFTNSSAGVSLNLAVTWNYSAKVPHLADAHMSGYGSIVKAAAGAPGLARVTFPNPIGPRLRIMVFEFFANTSETDGLDLTASVCAKHECDGPGEPDGIATVPISETTGNFQSYASVKVCTQFDEGCRLPYKAPVSGVFVITVSTSSAVVIPVEVRESWDDGTR